MTGSAGGRTARAPPGMEGNVKHVTLALLLLTAIGAMAQDAAPGERAGILVPQAVGVANLGDDPAGARTIALLDAQRLAIESALGVMVKSETEVDKYELVADRITTATPEGFVYDLEVVSEGAVPDQKVYEVVIRCRVGTGALITRIAEDFPDVYEYLERPRLVILLDEKDRDGHPGQAVTTALAEAFTARGLDVVERAQLEALGERDKLQQAAQGNGEAIAWLAAQLQAEVMIYGAAKEGATGWDVQARVVHAWDARIIAAGLAQGATAQACARGLLPGPAVADDLVVKMLGRWLADPTLLTITLARATYPQVSGLVKTLQPMTRPRTIDLAKQRECSRIPTFGQATMRSYNPRASLLEIRTPLRRMAAIEALGAMMDPLGYEITGVNGLRVDLAPKPE